MKKLFHWVTGALSFLAFIFSGIALYHTCGDIRLIPDSLTVILGFVGILAAIIGMGNYFITTESRKGIYTEIENAKKDFIREIDVLKDLNRPPYLDIVIKKSNDDEKLDGFKEEIYGVLNDYKGYRILDVHTFMKVNFALGEDITQVADKLEEMTKRYINSVNFDYRFILP